MDENGALVECYGKGKLKCWRKTCTSATLSTKNPITALGSNLGLCSKMPAINGMTCWYPHRTLQNIMSQKTTTVIGPNKCAATQQNWPVATTMGLLYSLVMPVVLLILLNSAHVWKVHCLLHCCWCAQWCSKGLNCAHHLSQCIIMSPGKFSGIWVLHIMTVPEWCYLHGD